MSKTGSSDGCDFVKINMSQQLVYILNTETLQTQIFWLLTQRREESADAITEGRRGMTSVMRYAVRSAIDIN